MNDDGRRLMLPPFPPGYHASGVLLHVSSLPSPYGIGDVGPAALAWVDRLHECIEERPMMNWPEVLLEMEHWADGFLTGAAAASLIAIAGNGIVLLGRAI